MSSPDPQVRAARNQSTSSARPGARGPVVAVTGAASGVGALLTARLAASDEVRQVVAIDERRGGCEAAQWQILDVRDPAIAEKLRGADVVVHLALDLDLETDAAARTAYNVRGTQTVLTAAAAAGVHRVVLCTSAMVYGALPDNELPLSEDAELRATAEATGVGDLLEIERLARRAPRAHPGLNVTVVRPAVLVGGMDTALTRYFESPRLLVVAGSRPAWQFCHVDDLCSALEYAVLEKADGELAVGCDGWLEQEEVEELSGIRRMELPSAVALGAAARLHRIGLTPSPVHDVPLGRQRQPPARCRMASEAHERGGPGGAARGGLGPAHGRRPASRAQGRDGGGRRGRDGGAAGRGRGGASRAQGTAPHLRTIQGGAAASVGGSNAARARAGRSRYSASSASWGTMGAWQPRTTTPASGPQRTP